MSTPRRYLISFYWETVQHSCPCFYGMGLLHAYPRLRTIVLHIFCDFMSCLHRDLVRNCKINLDMELMSQPSCTYICNLLYVCDTTGNPFDFILFSVSSRMTVPSLLDSRRSVSFSTFLGGLEPFIKSQ